MDLRLIADELVDAHDNAMMVAPISAADPGFDSADAYAVLDLIAARRRSQGWRSVGRKVGFTNRTIWSLYDVDRPMWAHIWDRTVQAVTEGRASLRLQPFVQPRIEPEVVFSLTAPVPVTDDPSAVLDCVEWMAPGFEIVQCPYPEWKFTLADCTAASALHGALVVGSPVPIDDENRATVAAMLPGFECTLRRDGSVVDQGVGANVLDSPALALAHLARVLADQPDSPPLAAGEIVTTGTVTNAWPIAPGERWTSDYGALGLDGLDITFT